MENMDYVVMLRESLEKKADVLRVLNIRNKEQEAILKDPNSTPDDLEKNMNMKSELIERIVMLDDGFEQLFNRVKAIIEADRDTYADEIRLMQELIKKVTALTADVEASEYRNKEYAKTRFANVKKEVREIKKSSDVVSSYYKHMMSPQTTADPAFLDKKK
ncbi:MAG: flagellar protein FliT [Pseudobutyrivibrio sp.]|uniref:flagellar protein FliT n=1 Tax=Pseudobutyrivibrio sp. TaxID=2014367 RepID=UPI001B09DD7E|nr:flagellar protein FliT [Pseudobutyrivibrio sp.]MBO5617644.1 flagellar protein FliT [Pseudobutyrivibrio sp.]MBO6283251.1 flagellar protein FliT [Pseudobutyrivibrio sp.]MBP3262956.1 flagellar protein FliT [Pseudobutyrivibrio sp.]